MSQMTSPPLVAVLNGPNMNMLGLRQPHLYGAATLDDVEQLCAETAEQLGLAIDFRQTNGEGELVSWVQECRGRAQGIVINPAGYTTTSIALMDALLASELPVIELHVTNIHRREEFRQHSYVSKVAVGVICGLVNGALIAKLKLPDFIVTLGTLSVFRGAALIYTNGQPIYGLPEGFRTAFGGQLLGVPTPVIMAIVVAGLAFFLVRFTALGEQIVAVGGNEEAARLSGINIDRVKIVVYTLSGLLSSLAGFVLIARIGAAEPIGGNGFELQAIGAAVIGGASLFGGVGNPLGSLIGALTLGGLQNGLTLMNVPSFWQYVASGVVVILAVYADRLARPRR